jgi:co-chaperonin GroES (HSP10)
MNSENNLPIEPVGYRLLIEPLRPQEKSVGGILLPSETQEAQGHLTYVGRVLAMGEDCYQHSKFNERTWCQVGDYVAHGRYSGQKMEVKKKDKPGEYVTYLLLNDDEILARVDDPESIKIYI